MVLMFTGHVSWGSGGSEPQKHKELDQNLHVNSLQKNWIIKQAQKKSEPTPVEIFIGKKWLIYIVEAFLTLTKSTHCERGWNVDEKQGANDIITLCLGGSFVV